MFKSNKQLNIPQDAELPIIAVGHNSYDKKLPHLLNGVSGRKFECDKIISPLNSWENEGALLRKEVETLQEKCTQKKLQVDHVKHEIQNLQLSINSKL